MSSHIWLLTGESLSSVSLFLLDMVVVLKLADLFEGEADFGAFMVAEYLGKCLLYNIGAS